ncbi:MAG TPA: SusD/RagB family nutrient-binding outer membrane lipoprotein [Bacteroidales bacterium]|nr:SusD/RagB family nutrient-binding outer membrane lipoprotein [Bacteroidales bacterium]HPT21334.1 SusD/RagB family nutrient-binding outer membrane lipoprotein [Bacteroidales bacterium]
MKRYKSNSVFMRFLFIVAAISSLISCTEKFDEYNVNKSKLMEVGPKELAGLFSTAQIEGCNWLTTDNYNRMSRTVGNHLSGLMCIMDITYEQNMLNLSYHSSGFVGIYSKAIPALQCIFDISKDESSLQNNYAIALVWKVWLLQQVTDFFGPIPYTDAGVGKENTTYQSQKEVYYLMFDDLKKAIDIMTASVAVNPTANAFGVGDMIYDGDVSKWLKFANTLRLRLAIRISNIDPDKAKTEGEAAAAGSTMSTNADDAFLAVINWDELGNGLCRVNPWYSSLMSSSIESFLKGYKDPRMEQYFAPVADPKMSTIPELVANIGGFHGFANGFRTTTEYNYAMYHSCLNTTRWNANTKLTLPIPILYSCETHFLKAEGAWRGWNMGVTAKAAYDEGIRVSMKQWTTISADSIQKYIDSENTPVAPEDYGYNHPAASDIPVKFSSNPEDQYEQIITQKWLSFFPNGVEAFAEYRRTRLPKIYPKVVSVNANINLADGQIITRLPFPMKEYNAQPEQVKAAIPLLGNGVTEDLENIPLWWDTNNNGSITPKF